MIDFGIRGGRQGGRRPPAPATVLSVESVTPHVRRIVLAGDSLRVMLEDAGQIAPTAWLKMFPTDDHGRAYTVRETDPGAGTLAIDIVLHDDAEPGTVAAWATTARAGDAVHIGGLRNGSFMLQPDADWIWIAVDSSSLPAAQAILATLPAHMTAYVTVRVAHPAERQVLRSRASVEETWQYDSSGEAPAVPVTPLMRERSGQAWIAGETGWVHRVAAAFAATRTLHESRISAKGYWKIGESGHRDRAGFGRR